MPSPQISARSETSASLKLNICGSEGGKWGWKFNAKKGQRLSAPSLGLSSGRARVRMGQCHWKTPPKPSCPTCAQSPPCPMRTHSQAFSTLQVFESLCKSQSALVDNRRSPRPLHSLQIHELFAAEHPPCGPTGAGGAGRSRGCPCSGSQLLHPAAIPAVICDLRGCSAGCCTGCTIWDSGLFPALFPYCQESEARRENYSLS